MAYDLGGGSIGAGLSGFGQNLGTALGSIPQMLQERSEKNQNKYFSVMEQEVLPVIGFANGALSLTRNPGATPGVGKPFDFKTLTEAWSDYKNKVGRQIRPDEFSSFKKKYTAMMDSAAPQLAQQFENMQRNGVSKGQIRKFLNDNPDLSLGLTKAGMVNPELGMALDEFMKPQGIGPGLLEKGGEIATAGMGVPAMRGAFKAYKGFKGAAAGEGLGGARKGFLKGVTPGREFLKRTAAAGLQKQGYGKLSGEMAEAGWNMGGKTKAKGLVTGAEEKLKSAQDKFKTQKRKYEYGKGNKRLKTKPTKKGAKPSYKRFDNTTEAKDIKKRISRYKKHAKKVYKPGYQKAMSKKLSQGALQNYIKKHGMSKLVKTMAKKIGMKGALKLGARLVGGGVLTATGVGAGVGLAMDAMAVYQIGKVLYDVVSEESGVREREGLQKANPYKMMFGGGAVPKTTQF